MYISVLINQIAWLVNTPGHNCELLGITPFTSFEPSATADGVRGAAPQIPRKLMPDPVGGRSHKRTPGIQTQPARGQHRLVGSDLTGGDALPSARPGCAQRQRQSRHRQAAFPRHRERQEVNGLAASTEWFLQIRVLKDGER